MAQPLLARLRDKEPDLEIDVLAPEWVAPVARRMPEVREVIAAPLRHGALQLGERWRIGRELKARGYRQAIVDRKSTRLNSSHMSTSYAVFCLKKKSNLCPGRP